MKPKKAAEEKPKLETTKPKTNRKKSPFELHEIFLNEIENDEKNINEQIFHEYFLSYSIIFSKRII